MSTISKPAVFFDRDGVINRSPGEGSYVLTPQEFHFLPGVREVLAEVKARGWLKVLITNQQCVGKGLLTAAGLDAIHASMQEKLGPELAFDRIEACTHLKDQCDCRKPSPTMIFTAAEALGINIAESWMVGDHDRDMETGRNAGVKVLVRFLSEKAVQVTADHTVATHAELLKVLQESL